MSQTTEELRAEAVRHREELATTVDAIEDRVSPSRMVERRTTRMKDAWGRTRDRVMGSADHAVHALSDAAGSATSSATAMPSSAAGKAAESTAGNPMVAGAVAFGVGFLAAAAFPGTRTEQRAAAQLRDAAQGIAPELREAGQDAMDHLREPAQQAVQAVKEAAQDSVTDVQDVARATAHDTQGAASDAMQQVKSEAKG
jgi:hypothetical protein